MNPPQFLRLASPLCACGYFLTANMKTLYLPSGKKVVLTPTEGRILGCLLLHPRQVVTRSYLTRHALGTRFLKHDRAIDVHVSRLRKKFGKYEDSLASRYGRGYLIVPSLFAE